MTAKSSPAIVKIAVEKYEAAQKVRECRVNDLALGFVSSGIYEQLLESDATMTAWSYLGKVAGTNDKSWLEYCIREKISIYARVNRSTSQVSNLQDEYALITWCKALEIVAGVID